MRQKHCWNCFAFNQLYLAKGKIAPVVLFRDVDSGLSLHFRLEQEPESIF